MATLQELRYKTYLALQKQKKNQPTTLVVDQQPAPEDNKQPPKELTQYEKLTESARTPKSSLYKEIEGRIILTTEEKVFQGSYGIDPVLIRLEQVLTSPSCKVNTVLINVATCIRNALDKDLNLIQNIQKIELELQTIIQTLIDLFNKSVIGVGYIVCYLGDYHQKLPKEKLRPQTPGKDVYFSLLDNFLKLFDKYQRSTHGKVTVNFVRCNKGVDYGNQLQIILRGISEIIPSATYTGHYCLVSHQPLDFHVMNKCPMGLLIASHTGEIFNNKMLGYKVFKEEHVPFNLLLHGLLGDKEQIKPSVSIKARMAIREKAYVDKWHLKSEMYIRQQLRSIGIVITS